MQITVNVEEVDLTSVVSEHTVWDEDEQVGVPQTLGELVAARLVDRLVKEPDYRAVAAEVHKARTAQIRERVAAQIEEALTEPVHQTNSWGESSGPPTTLRSEIARIATEAVKVAQPGAYRREETALEKLIRTEIGVALAKELAGIVAEEKAKVVAAVRGKAAELIASAVKEGVGR